MDFRSIQGGETLILFVLPERRAVSSRRKYENGGRDEKGKRGRLGYDSGVATGGRLAG